MRELPDLRDVSSDGARHTVKTKVQARREPASGSIVLSEAMSRRPKYSLKFTRSHLACAGDGVQSVH
jgi:hypothetical protein